MTKEKTAAEVAAGVASAIANLDTDALGDLYDDDIVIWHNFERRTQNKAENLRALDDLFSKVKELAYVDIDVELTQTGYVQQHILVGKLTSGKELILPCCHVVKVRNGKIFRFNEYLDSTAMRAAFAE